MKVLKLSSIAFTALLMFGIYACQKDLKNPDVTSDAKQSNKLDAPTIACGNSTYTSIDLIVTAGASGAPAGFSVQWMLKTEWESSGWPTSSDIVEGSSFCKASFSGVPGCSNYNLAPNTPVTVKIGDLLDACGASGGCGDLLCGKEYVFRVFAHNEPGTKGRAKSDFSENAYCSTLDCPDGGDCVYTQGYWRTHGPDGCRTGNNSNEWPESVLTNGLTIGGNLYDANELCTMLKTPAGGTNLNLAHQLIAALLNQANGAPVPESVQNCIDGAQTLLTQYGINGKTPNDFVSCLDQYNNGLVTGGPVHCE